MPICDTFGMNDTRHLRWLLSLAFLLHGYILYGDTLCLLLAVYPCFLWYVLEFGGLSLSLVVCALYHKLCSHIVSAAWFWVFFCHASSRARMSAVPSEGVGKVERGHLMGRTKFTGSCRWIFDGPKEVHKIVQMGFRWVERSSQGRADRLCRSDDLRTFLWWVFDGPKALRKAHTLQAIYL